MFFCDRKDHNKCEFSVHDVFAVDLLISTGDGKTKEKDTRTTVYKKTENIYSLKMKASRGITVNAIFTISLCMATFLKKNWKNSIDSNVWIF